MIKNDANGRRGGNRDANIGIDYPFDTAEKRNNLDFAMKNKVFQNYLKVKKKLNSDIASSIEKKNINNNTQEYLNLNELRIDEGSLQSKDVDSSK